MLRWRLLPLSRLPVVTLALLGALSLPGCGASQLASYDLASIQPAHTARPLRGALVVSDPIADEAVDSDRIVVRTDANSLAYLSDARWTDRLPDLVQERLIGTFQNARLLKFVGHPGDPSDYSLEVTIRKFEIDVQTSLARVELAVRLLSRLTNKPIAARLFAATAPAPTTANGAAANALDSALGQVMRQIVAWTAQQI
ncbi:MAG: membrane integrity-associated transporter subunit PqiC [Hyphomicrobiales bacterium]|nr:membrane integrity-associated transporter subunit PqiC [Hyphomicrobiales bacterium]